MSIGKILVLHFFFYKFEKVHQVSTNRIGIFGQAALKCLIKISNAYKFIGANN